MGRMRNFRGEKMMISALFYAHNHALCGESEGDLQKQGSENKIQEDMC